MALNFNVLAQVPSVAERFMAGRQAAQEEQQRNMLLQQRQMEFSQAQEDRQKAQAREAQFQQLADLMAQNGLDPDDPKVLGEFGSRALKTGNTQLFTAITAMADRAAKRREASAGKAATQAEMASIFGPQAGAAPAAAAPGMGAPPVTSTLIDEGAPRPEARVPLSIEGGAQAMPVQPQAQVTTRDISTGNALAPAAPAAAPQNRLVTREQVQRGLMSTNPAVRDAAVAMSRLLPPQEKPVDTRPKPEKVQLGDRVVFLDMNPSSPTFRQEVISQRVGAAPEAPGAAASRALQEERVRLERGRLELQQQQAAAQAARDEARAKNDAAAAARAQMTLDQANRRLDQMDAQFRLAEKRFEAESKKLSPAAEKAVLGRQQQAADIDLTVKELEAAVAKGGLIDQSTGSIAGAAGDVAAATMGVATQGAIAIGKLQPIADMVLKTVPRFEGPQSDKDTQSYKEAAGQLANPNVPREIRKEAAKTIIRLMKERKGQFATLDEAAAAARSGRGSVGGEGAPAAPPQQAVDALLRGVGTDAQFDEIFGPGAAARARGR